MATKKLTAQQKRDREFMILLEDALAKQEQDLRVAFEHEKYASYMKGFKFGAESMEGVFKRMSRLDRFFWKASK